MITNAQTTLSQGHALPEMISCSLILNTLLVDFTPIHTKQRFHALVAAMGSPIQGFQ